MVCREGETVSKKKKKREKGENLFFFRVFFSEISRNWKKMTQGYWEKNTYEEKNCVRKTPFSPCFEMTTVAQTQEIVAKFSHMVDPMKEYTGDEMANMLGKVFRYVTGKEITLRNTDKKISVFARETYFLT